MNTNLWLIGKIKPIENVKRLPLAIDVLKAFLYQQTVNTAKEYECAKKLASDLMTIWQNNKFSTLRLQNIIIKIKKLKEKYDALKKSRFRRTSWQSENEKKFMKDVQSLFNIKCQQVNEFFSKTTLVFDDKNDNRDNRPEAETYEKLKNVNPNVLICPEKRVRQNCSHFTINNNEVEDIDIDPDVDAFQNLCVGGRDDDNDWNFEETVSVHYKKQLVKKRPGILKTIINAPDVTSAVDRAKISTPQFTMIAAAIARACEDDINNDSISTSTVDRKRSLNRQTIVANIRDEFDSLLESVSGLIIHWDGKIMKNYNNAEEFDEDDEDEVDRIAIVATGFNGDNQTKINQILNVAKVNDGTGKIIAKTVHHNIVDWKATNKVVGMCFDTTSPNTGHKNGACVLLQNICMKRKLLWFACRHHVYEVILTGVFIALYGDTKSPGVEIFKRFKGVWDQMDKSKFQPMEKKYFKRQFASSQRKDMIEFLSATISNQSAVYIPRKDYLELMELCLLILGHPIENYTFKSCGPDHHARWMSKLIYSFKIYLFRQQFLLSEQEEDNLRNFCLFGCLVYVKYWIKCPQAVDAPINDFKFYAEIQKYKIMNKVVADSAINKIENHLWYLSSELVILSLFSEEVSPDEKIRMVSAMTRLLPEDPDWSHRHIRLTNTTSLTKMRFSDLIGPGSMHALRKLNLNIDFMFTLDPQLWSKSGEYQRAKLIVSNLKVVNDVAEQAIQTMATFNEILTKKESEKQAIIQVVADNRKRIPVIKKKVLASYKRR